MSDWKGIIMAGGTGSRLFPITKGVSKQLLPVYDKPMIYYPLSVLMLSNIREIAIITTSESAPFFYELLGTGEQWGCNFHYVKQEKPAGIAQAFPLCRHLFESCNTCLILGDNLFYGEGLTDQLEKAMDSNDGATIFACRVSDPSRYGIVELDSRGNCISIEEKPKLPRSNLAVTGLYYFDDSVYDIAENIRPSLRGELEITDINKVYWERKKLKVEIFERGMAWLDTGTHESLLQASSFIHAVQSRQGLMVASPDEIAWRMGNIDTEAFLKLADIYSKTGYGTYLRNLVLEGRN